MKIVSYSLYLTVASYSVEKLTGDFIGLVLNENNWNHAKLPTLTGIPSIRTIINNPFLPHSP